jgi:hypothetical protein
MFNLILHVWVAWVAMEHTNSRVLGEEVNPKISFGHRPEKAVESALVSQPLL